MPQLQLFRRRWHTATDALPLLMALLCIFHVLWFVPYATGAWSIEGTGLKYQCPHATELRVANYSLFALFGLAAINEAVLTVVGLRGGPFETKKRRAVAPLLYVEVALWALLLAFTIYATVVVYSDAVDDSCWSNNPCQYAPDEFPLACHAERGSAVRDLTPSCRAMLNAGPQFFACWTDWMVAGLNWVTDTVQLINGWGNTVYDAVLDGLAEEQTGNVTGNATGQLPGAELSQLEDQASVLTNCVLFYFLSCYSYHIGRMDLVESLKEENTKAFGAACTFWDDLTADPASACSARNVVWDASLMDGFGKCNGTQDTAYWSRELSINIILANTSDYRNGNIYLGNSDNVEEYNQFLQSHPDIFQYTNYELLKAINTSTQLDLTNGIGPDKSKASDMPWFFCLDAQCQMESHYADNCTQWAQILSLPNPKNRKTFFEIMVITSWTVLGITAVIVFVCFNAFPDYNDVDSWEGTVRSIDRLCLCGGGLAGSANVSGSDMSVSREIAKSLNLLFGGVDLDATDRLLGIYLVSERQHRRRQEDVLAALQGAGYVLERRHSTWGLMLDRITPMRWRTRNSVATTRSSVSSQSAARALPADVSVPAVGAAARDVAAENRAASASPNGTTHLTGSDSVAPQAVPLPGGAAQPAASAQSAAASLEAQSRVAAGHLPMSPFDMPAPAPQVSQRVSTRLSAGSTPGDSRLMMYEHSMIRLRSSLDYQASVRAHPVDVLATVEEGGVLPTVAESTEQQPSLQPSSGAEPEHVLEEPEQGTGNASIQTTSTLQQTGTHRTGGSWQNAAIRVAARYHPLLTPSGFATKGQPLDPPISPQAAADIYAGKLDPVDNGTLRDAQHISRFAVASYGLQGVIWAKGRRPNMCLANANRLVKCFKRPLGLEDKFRKRNFDAIIEMTGVQPSDLLYVSYTNVAGGVLPYLIMLHRPSKSVVLSVRGTVSMEDLITDLLSNPVDVADWVPEWVHDEAARRKAAGIAGDASGSSLKAHIGIVSSATAILKDMEERGLLKEMLLSKLLRAATAMGRDTQEVIAEFLETHRGELPELAPQAMKSGSTLTSNPVAAAAAGLGLHDVIGKAGSRSVGRIDKKDKARFLQAEKQHISRIMSLKEEREVDLPVERAQAIIRSKLQQQGWRVVVTGHSLGAAVACMLGMQLRERFADLQCWAFNPPGGLVSWELAQIAELYCTSIVVGKDVISRLSFNTSKRVVDEMVVSLARCKRPKLKILADVVLGRRKRPESTPRTFCKFEDMPGEALHMVEQYYRASHLHMRSADTTEMYPPGKLVFLRPFKGKRKQQTVWDAVWINAATLISEGILVTPTMMAHHRLFVLAEAFESIFAGEAATEAAAQDEQGEEDLLNIMNLAL